MTASPTPASTTCNEVSFINSICFIEKADGSCDKVTANSWIFIIIQIAFALALCFLFAVRKYIYRNTKDEIVISKDSQRLKKERFRKFKRKSKQLDRKGDTRRLLELHDEPLTDTSRSESNFMKTNADSDINFPSKALPEYVPSPNISIMEFLRTLSCILHHDRSTKNKVIACTALSLFSSSASSILAMMFRLDRLRDDNACNADGNIKDWILGFETPYGSAIDAFKFLPTFLILAYVAFLVDRWRTFMVTCHEIQGKSTSQWFPNERVLLYSLT